MLENTRLLEPSEDEFIPFLLNHPSIQDLKVVWMDHLGFSSAPHEALLPKLRSIDVDVDFATMFLGRLADGITRPLETLRCHRVWMDDFDLSYAGPSLTELALTEVDGTIPTKSFVEDIVLRCPNLRRFGFGPVPRIATSGTLQDLVRSHPTLGGELINWRLVGTSLLRTSIRSRETRDPRSSESKLEPCFR